MAELLMSNTNSLNANQRTFVSAIQTSSELMESIANDVLDMSKFEAGKLDMKIITFDLWGLLDEMESVYSLVAEKKNILFEVIYNHHEIPRFIRGDSIRLRQILVNLLCKSFCII